MSEKKEQRITVGHKRNGNKRFSKKINTNLIRHTIYTYVQRNIKTLSRNHCCSVKAISITYSECVSVALGIQHAMRMCRIILSSVACLDLPDFPTSSHERHDFREKFVK